MYTVSQCVLFLRKTLNLLIILFLCATAGLWVYRLSIAELLFTKYHNAYLLSVLNPSDAALNQTLGNHYFSHEYYDVARAEKHFNRALEINPNTSGAHYQLGRIKFIRGDLIDAMVEFEDEMAVNPSFGKTHYMKGLTAGYLKNFTLAETEFKAFIAFDSFNWAGYNDLAWIQFALGKYESAEQTAKLGLSKTNHNPWLHNSVGVALLAQGKKSEARGHFLFARDGFSAMTKGEWGGSYPGNDPSVLGSGLQQTLDAVRHNIELTQE